MKQSALILATLGAGMSLLTSAQAQFQNLGFESALLQPIPADPYSRVLFAPAFRGWSGYVGGVPVQSALYNNLFLDSSGISIVDHSFAYGSVIQGSFTAILQAGLDLETTQPADTRLSQTGVVPSGTQSLLFEARFVNGSPPTSFAVSLGGQNLSLEPLSTSGDVTLYAADVRQWAGQTAELAFTVSAPSPHASNAYLALDAIQFSDVPEPGCFGLLAVAAGLLGGKRLWNGLRPCPLRA